MSYYISPRHITDTSLYYQIPTSLVTVGTHLCNVSTHCIILMCTVSDRLCTLLQQNMAHKRARRSAGSIINKYNSIGKFLKEYSRFSLNWQSCSFPQNKLIYLIKKTFRLVYPFIYKEKYGVNRLQCLIGINSSFNSSHKTFKYNFTMEKTLCGCLILQLCSLDNRTSDTLKFP